MNTIDEEGDRPDSRLADKPPEVFLAVYDVDAADKDATEEEPHHAEEDEERPAGLPSREMAEPGDRECQRCGKWGERFIVSIGRHGWVSPGRGRNKIGGPVLTDRR